MDNKKTGKLIKKLRIEKNMTQKDLAELLHITDRAVSKWECGISAPDISLLEPISQILDVSIPELLSGQKGTVQTHVIKLNIPSFNACLKVGAILLFTWCVILNDSVSIYVPSFLLNSGNPNLFKATGNYQINKIISQLIHQFPIFYIEEGYLCSLLVASLIVTISGLLWAILLCSIIYPSGWKYHPNRSEEHISLSKLSACILLFQSSKVLRPEAIYDLVPFNYLILKQFIGLPLCLLTIAFLIIRIKKRIAVGESNWKSELKTMLPFFIGTSFWY